MSSVESTPASVGESSSVRSTPRGAGVFSARQTSSAAGVSTRAPMTTSYEAVRRAVAALEEERSQLLSDVLKLRADRLEEGMFSLPLPFVSYLGFY